MVIRTLRFFSCVFCVSALLLSGTSLAQDDFNGGGDGFQQPGGDPTPDTFVPTNNIPTTGNTGGGDLGSSLDPFGSDFFDSLTDNTPTIENGRENGFVGPSADKLGGSFSDALDPLGHTGPTFAAINEAGNNNGGFDFGGGAANRGGAAGNQGGTDRGFTVERGGIRTRVRRAFAAQMPNNSQISTRFRSELTITPSTQDFANAVNVSVENGRAIVSGTLQSQDQADRIVGQLRLTPGVYRIENRMTIGN